jgi:glycosyltransferase involved in cell wall biosynthesis
MQKKSSFIDQAVKVPQPPRLKKPVRITEQVWPEGTVPVVTIRCITYNHAKFIREAIEGFLMQETTFPVEILVHDDASTDETAEIISDYEEMYPQLFCTVLQSENQWSQGKWPRDLLNSMTRGEFVALCEGDDYWTDPLKLQKQADYLRTHPGVRLLCTRYLTRRGDTLEGPLLNFSRVVTTKNWAFPYSLSTATAMFRLQDLVQSSPSEQVPNVKDIFIWRLLLEKGDAHVLPECTAVYRIHPQGIWSQKDKFQQSLSNLKTAKSMLQHIGKNHPDLRAFYQGSFKDCLKFLELAKPEQIRALWHIAWADGWRASFRVALSRLFFKWNNLFKEKNTSCETQTTRPEGG